MNRNITLPLVLGFKHHAVSLLICLLFFNVSSINATTRNAGTEVEFNTALSSSIANDIINLTNNIVVSVEKNLNKNLTINGNGFTISVPNPGLDDMGRFNTVTSSFRVFTISAGYNVTINNLSIKGGSVTSSGGAISVLGTLHLNNSVVSNSRCSWSGGGGISISTNAVVFLRNSLINRNAANFGGGFMNYGKMYIENSTFSENRSTSLAGGGGAGENQSFLYVNNSTFSNNQSTEIGGAINNVRGTIYIANTSITGNVCYGAANFQGGGIGNNGGTVYAINSLFAHNYHRTGGDVTSPTSYILDDINAYSLQNNVFLYYCIYHAALPVGTNNVIGNIQYTGLANGSNNTIFSGGALSKITDGTGTEIGTASIYRPFLYNNGGLVAPTLKIGSFLLQGVNKGTQTRFANNDNDNPTIAYYNQILSTWVDRLGVSNSEQVVNSDQISALRANPPVIGAIETATAENLYMVKINVNPNGSVNGGTFFGDVYASGTSVTITAIPYSGYHFVRWDYVGGVGGSGTASASNPYTFTVNNDITLVPVFEANESTYDITYIGNDNTSGDAPLTASYSGSTTILSTGTLERTGYSIEGWNTNANGSGTNYAVGSTYSLGVNLTLYAKWTMNIVISPNVASDIKLRTATIGATITPVGATVLERGICWSYNSGVSITDHNTPVTGTSGGLFMADLTGLNRGSTIYYKGYYTTSQGTYLSAESSFNNTPEFTGDGDWEDATKWNVQQVPGETGVGGFGSSTDSPIINGTCALTVSNSVTNLKINSGKKLIINKAVAMVVEGALTNEATTAGLIIKAGDKFVQNGSLIFTDKSRNQDVPASVEMYSKAFVRSGQSHWQYFGIPVQSQAVGTTFSGGSERVRRYNEANRDVSGYNRGLWYPYPALSMAAGETLYPVTGYEVVQSTEKIYTFKGNLNARDFDQTIAFTENADWAGQNIIANPYAAAIDISKLTNFGLAEEAVYLFNTGSIEEWNANKTETTPGNNPGTYIVSTPGTAGLMGIPAQIPSMQGFLVKTDMQTTLNIPYSSVTNNNGPQRIRTADDKVATMIDVIGNQSSDRMWILIEPTCTRNFDNGFDGRKILGSNTQIYAMEEDGDYQINAINDINNSYLGFQSGGETSFKLIFTHQNIESKYSKLNLVDLVDNKTIDITLSGSEYVFTAFESTTPSKRFKITTTTSDNALPAVEQIRIFSSQKSGIIQNSTDQEGNVIIYNMSGLVVRNVPFKAKGITTISDLKPGAYIFKAKTDTEKVNSNLIIH